LRGKGNIKEGKEGIEKKIEGMRRKAILSPSLYSFIPSPGRGRGRGRKKGSGRRDEKNRRKRKRRRRRPSPLPLTF